MEPLRRGEATEAEPEERPALGGRGGDGMAGLPLFEGEAEIKGRRLEGMGL
jgi:hypothetical protein